MVPSYTIYADVDDHRVTDFGFLETGGGTADIGGGSKGQFFPRFDTSSVLGSVATAHLLLSVQNAVLNPVIRIRDRGWSSVTAANYTTSFGSYPLLGTSAAIGGTGPVSIDLSSVTVSSAWALMATVAGDEDATGFTQASVSTADAGGTTNDPYLSITTSVGFTLSCDGGSFTLTGQSADLKASRRLDLASGSFALAGQNVGLLAGRKLSAGGGSFTFTGQPVGVRADRVVSCGAGAFALTGHSAGLLAGRRLAAEPGAFTLTWGHFGIVYWPLVRPVAVTWTSIAPTTDNGWSEVSPWR